MTSLTWQHLAFRDLVTTPNDGLAEVVGVRACTVHAGGDAQLRLATDGDKSDPLWYPVAGLRRVEAVDAR